MLPMCPQQHTIRTRSTQGYLGRLFLQQGTVASDPSDARPHQMLDSGLVLFTIMMVLNIITACLYLGWVTSPIDRTELALIDTVDRIEGLMVQVWHLC